MAIPLRMGALPAVALGVALAGYGSWIHLESTRQAKQHNAVPAQEPAASALATEMQPQVTVVRPTAAPAEPAMLPGIVSTEASAAAWNNVTPISYEQEAEPQARYGNRYSKSHNSAPAETTPVVRPTETAQRVEAESVPPQPGPLARPLAEQQPAATQPAEGVTVRFNEPAEQKQETPAEQQAVVTESNKTAATPVVTATAATKATTEPAPLATQSAETMPRTGQGVSTVRQTSVAPTQHTARYAAAPQYFASEIKQQTPPEAQPQPQPAPNSACCNQPNTCDTGSACCTNKTCEPSCLIDCCEPCGPYGRTWVQMDYLGWWLRDAYVPALVTTSPAGTPIGDAGVLGEPGTSILYGDENLGGEYQSGGRLRFGHWLDDCQTIGLQGEFFAIGNDTDGFAAGSDSFILARPFYNTQTGGQDSQIITYPGVNEGLVEINSSTQFLGAGAQMIHNICCESWCDSCATGCGGCFDPLFAENYRRVDFLIGYRYLGLNDGLNIAEQTTSVATGGVIPQGTTFTVFDEFQTENDFHGGEIGLMFSRGHGRWTLDVLTRVALGTNRQNVRIAGNTIIDVPGLDPSFANQGLLAQPTNIGSYSRNRFAVVPEIGVNLGYRLTENLKVYAGYTFIYWGNVVRAGEQIDTAVNPSQLSGPLVGPARPAFNYVESGFWAQGINIGTELRF